MPGRKPKCVMLPCFYPDILIEDWGGRGSETFAHKYRLTILTDVTTLFACLSSIFKHVSIQPPSLAIVATAQRNTASSKTERKPAIARHPVPVGSRRDIVGQQVPLPTVMAHERHMAGETFHSHVGGRYDAHMCADPRDTRDRPKIAVVPSKCSNS